jgi:hypothetical protein
MLEIRARDLYTCQRTNCRRIEGGTCRLVCDHVQPHRGDVEKFWSGPFLTDASRKTASRYAVASANLAI